MNVLPAPPSVLDGRAGRLRRLLPWTALVLLMVVAQSLLVWLTVSYEANRAQEQAEVAALEAAAEVRREVLRGLQELQSLSFSSTTPEDWLGRAQVLLQQRRDILRVERRDTGMVVREAEDSPFGKPLFSRLPREDLEIEAEVACRDARRTSAPAFSRSYFVPQDSGLGAEVMDLCLPLKFSGRDSGFIVATFSLTQLLEGALTPPQARRHELSFVEGDGARLARAGAPRGAGIFLAERVVDLPGRSMLLRADSTAGRPSLIPNLTLALVLGLSLALFGLVILLARDVRRRAVAERALAESLAFRKAMEDSLSTGLRARDMQGRITYVNPAFCSMVGFEAREIVGVEPPPYWPPEQVEEYTRRQSLRLSAPGGSREGFETVFMRRGGERFPVMIYEAPLVDVEGRQNGWMSAVLDVSEQRKVEDLSRQQQERLQASARLATVGEMASLLSHELNQPLSAIASYATGSLNLYEQPDAHTPVMVKQALERIAEQAERAGRVIKSVHDFVRRREQHHEAIGCDRLFESVMPLIRLQARKTGARIEVDLPDKAPTVRCDRTMVEQVLLNLARNGIQAMETVPLERRVLRLAAQPTHERWVTLSVTDAGVGIGPEVAQRLFTPFYSTRSEGMGLGLSLCRTVIEQHGGALDFDSPHPAGGSGGTRFRFTLPANQPPAGAAKRPSP